MRITLQVRRYIRRQLYNVHVSSLETTFALRFLLNIPPYQNRIINLHEGMTYRDDKKVRLWTFYNDCRFTKFFMLKEILAEKIENAPPLVSGNFRRRGGAFSIEIL